jgi:hypothetical protein
MHNELFSPSRVFLACAIGLFLTVMVAWSCAILINYADTPPRRTTTADGSSVLDVRHWIHPGVERLRVIRGWYISEALIPNGSWSELAKPTEDFLSKKVPAEGRWEDARGWPLLCLRSVGVREVGTRREVIRHGIMIRHGVGQGIGTFREPSVLPVRPIWSGFQMNALLYAAASYIILTLTSICRSWRRWLRGKCVVCGYTLHDPHTICPECGTAISNKYLTQNVR